jgi:hypothetical protein
LLRFAAPRLASPPIHPSIDDADVRQVAVVLGMVDAVTDKIGGKIDFPPPQAKPIRWRRGILVKVRA